MIEVTVVDGAGNTAMVSGDALASRVRGAPSIRVMNANLTFWAEDLFDYGYDDALADDDYSSFYTDYGDDY